jgi:hypothetical protein
MQYKTKVLELLQDRPQLHIASWAGVDLRDGAGTDGGVGEAEGPGGTQRRLVPAIVGTQAVNVLACLLVPALAPAAPDVPLFVP